MHYIAVAGRQPQWWTAVAENKTAGQSKAKRQQPHQASGCRALTI